MPTNQLPRKLPPLRQVRLAKGLGLIEVGDRAGVDKGYLSRIERGLQQPSLPVLARLAQALELRELARLLEPYIEEDQE